MFPQYLSLVALHAANLPVDSIQLLCTAAPKVKAQSKKMGKNRIPSRAKHVELETRTPDHST